MKGWIGLSASVVLHASVVGVLWLMRPDPKPIVVAPPAKHATKVALASPLPKRGEGQGEGRQQPKKRPAAKPVIAAVSDTAPVQDEVVAAPEPIISEESAAPQGDEAPTPLAPSGERERSFDVSALHAALAESARRCYPAAAKRFHLTGEAQVDFCLDASGALTSTKLEASSGQQLLDTAARECVIAGAMPMPSEASGACYTVPVRFR